MGWFWVVIAAARIASASFDADLDGDGLSDREEASAQTDPTDCDTDDDGLGDALELGHSAPAVPASAGCFMADADPRSTTSPLLADSDEGGVEDGSEDQDHNGEIGPWETDPNLGLDDPDGDKDGIPDALEARCALAGPSDDRDEDTVPDRAEGRADPDGDALPAFCDDDDDGDGIPTVTEGTADTDGDGDPDYLDADADGDGIPDVQEGGDDVDCDGLPDFQDPSDIDGGCSDPDQDGLDNDAEDACGSDPLAVDTDGDGVDDPDEACDVDADCDLLPDRLDATDDPGLCDAAAAPAAEAPCVTTDVFLDCGALRGGSCAVGGGSPSPWLALGPLLLLGRKRR